MNKLLKSTLLGLALTLVFTGAQAKEKAPASAPAASASAVAAAPSASAKAELMDLNTATKEELATLPKIGDVRADAIVKGRPVAKTRPP